MTDQEVLYDVKDGIATITINRAEARNAMNRAVRDGLRAAFLRFEDDDEALVAILTGAGDKAFSAGGDLKEMSDTAMKIPPPDFIPFLERTITVNKPIIAAVNGFALAGGWLLAQMCDLCVAADHATFGISEAKWSRGAPWAAPLLWMIPQRIILEILMTAEPISAQRAYEIGFVNHVVPAAELQTAARELALKIAGNAPLTVRASKRMVYEAANLGRLAALDRADEVFEPVYLSEDAQEGPLAFKEKRKPNWQGK